MGNRLLFKVNVIANNKRKCIGWLEEPWSADNADDIIDEYVKQLRKAKIKGATTAYEAVKLLIAAGNAFYGHRHCIQTPNCFNAWDGKTSYEESCYIGEKCVKTYPKGTDLLTIFNDVMKPNVQLLKEHPDLMGVTNESEYIGFFVGTGDLYPSYVYSGMQNVVEIDFDPSNPVMPISATAAEKEERKFFRSTLVPALKKNIKTINNLLKPKRGKNTVLTAKLAEQIESFYFTNQLGYTLADCLAATRSKDVDVSILVYSDIDCYCETNVNVTISPTNEIVGIDWDGTVEFNDTGLALWLEYEINDRGTVTGTLEFEDD